MQPLFFLSTRSLDLPITLHSMSCVNQQAASELSVVSLVRHLSVHTHHFSKASPPLSLPTHQRTGGLSTLRLPSPRRLTCLARKYTFYLSWAVSTCVPWTSPAHTQAYTQFQLARYVATCKCNIPRRKTVYPFDLFLVSTDHVSVRYF
jgi:hypothetical protein